MVADVENEQPFRFQKRHNSLPSKLMKVPVLISPLQLTRVVFVKVATQVVLVGMANRTVLGVVMICHAIPVGTTGSDHVELDGSSESQDVGATSTRVECCPLRLDLHPRRLTVHQFVNATDTSEGVQNLRPIGDDLVEQVEDLVGELGRELHAS